MVIWIAQLCLCIGSLFFMAKRLLRYLHYMQLEEYSPLRFLYWIWKNRAFDRKGSYTALCVSASIFLIHFPYLSSFLGVSVLGIIAFLENDPRKNAKVSLKLTERARRIYFLTMV